jgi:D-alanine-D-alanine ligase-like ATP-grasp enzyme
LELIKYNVVKFDTESSLGKTVRKSRFESAKMNQQFLIKAAKLEKLRALDKNSLKKLRLAVIGNLSTINGNPIDNELSVTVTKVSETLKEAGYEIDVYNVNDFNNFLKSFDPKKTDLVINLTKKINNSTLLGAQLPTLLESWDVPYTGSSTISNLLCKDKIKFKKILKFHEIPTPDWDYMYDLSDEL